MEKNNIQEKFAQFMKKEDTKKTVKIAIICAGAVILLAAAAYAVYKLFFCREEEYDLYDELDFYYDDAAEEAAEEPAQPEECGCGCSDEAAKDEETQEEGCCAK